MLGVTVDPARPEEDLQVAEKMTDNEEDQMIPVTATIIFRPTEER